EIKVKVGDQVKSGQVVAIMEAMKMENDLPSALNGTVKDIRVQKGAQVSTGDVLIVIG
ncbi:MAG: acetyl-CoA carboxylase biotin carboxyl carrier protein subunit, partial [Desulfamplus sp.]|nr:acetyl-CoA carboxylase biotin carboxyl carrier protein subunit [Desulfamplus sp.]